MVREKVTITLDRAKAEEVRRLTGATSTSGAIDVALTETIRAARIRSDVAAYGAAPPTADEVAVASVSPDWSDLADDTDWDAISSADT